MAPRLPKRRGDALPPDPPDDSSPADLKQAIAALPAQPGVYLFRDRNGLLLYVGKAKRLDARVRSHFQDPEALGPRQVVLTRRTQAIEYIAAQEEEAGINYFCADLIFGDITFEEASRTVELFESDIIPAFDFGPDLQYAGKKSIG
jgi:hypothetical protein